ncbi:MULTISPECIES: AroM family protein [unclassified Bacillus (in: firmicutes)]|uniref:AroM family protein n=1 Tax=unclassified Bacillus (in: firmicutes) TaxID=185979 RepID=UPI0027B88AAD|nr:MULTISPECIES: AroM family protein [unclassified Bacillus (in: firmicutes)]
MAPVLLRSFSTFKYKRRSKLYLAKKFSVFKNDLKKYEKAANELMDKVNIILLDCMAYTEQSSELVSKLTGLPVIVSNAIMTKLVLEMI